MSNSTMLAVATELSKLIQLDVDAVGAYGQAIERTEVSRVQDIGLIDYETDNCAQ